MKTLVIVESPAKAKTIEKYLGSDYKVMSSVGHIRDLATSGPGGLGIDVENDFLPSYKYITGKKKVVTELLNMQKKVDRVLIATDPDREGEAIGWHLAEVLNLDYEKNNRIVFNEITKSAVTAGIENIQKLDIDLVHSQESRRIIDRIIGFKLSALLKKKIKVQSAGRVQSVALRMIVEREEEINKFIAKEYWTLSAIYQDLELEYEKNKDKISSEKVQKLIQKMGKNKMLRVQDIKVKTKKQNPYRIFTTSTLQQTAASKLHFPSRKTMQVAQKLYEGIDVGNGLEGLITYMRTDSTRISSEIASTVYSMIKMEYGKEYVGVYGQKKINGQDAHEGIRPTNIYNTPEKIAAKLSAEQLKLYTLIWKRTVSALMKAATLETTTYVFEHQKKVKFKTSYTVDLFDGFKILETKKKKPVRHDFVLNQEIEVEKFVTTQHFTQPRARFTEASLIKELEENGVGRPSTYATIIDILKKRNYVVVDQKAFSPTEDGILVVDQLRAFFEEFINVKYTAELEEKLDDIAVGETTESKTLNEFYQFFKPLLENANQNMEVIGNEEVGRKCPECGQKLVQRKSKFGMFVGCSNFPKCKYNEIKNEVFAPCPKCKTGEIIAKKTRRGKDFFACNRFPKCDYAVWNKEDIGKEMPEKKKVQKNKSKK